MQQVKQSRTVITIKLFMRIEDAVFYIITFKKQNKNKNMKPSRFLTFIRRIFLRVITQLTNNSKDTAF